MPSPPTLHPVPDPEPAARRFTWRFAAKLAATAALLALAAYALARPGAVERERRALLDEARAAGVAPEALRELAIETGRESDPAAMRLAAARALLNREIARQPPWRVEETRERLGRVQELARGVIAEQPSSWQALTLYASALTLMRTRTADTRLFTRFEEWERPLELAVELGPSYRFPKETLAFVYLEVWPAIAPSKRPEVEAILREAFEDREVFNRLFPRWLTIAGSAEAAARLVPDRTWAWQLLAESAYHRRDWPASLLFSARLRAARDAELTDALDRAESALARGQTRQATSLFDETLVRLPIDRGSVERLERIVARRPGGPATQAAARAALAWLDWQEPLVLLGQAPLSAAAAGRLAFLAAESLPPERAALAYLAGGDLPRAELLERRSQALWSEKWAPYLTLKARRALEARDTAAARAALEQVHRDFQTRLAWSVLAGELGVEPAPGGFGSRRPPPAAAAAWDAASWTGGGEGPRLELLPERAAAGLEVELAEPPTHGALLDLVWDGASTGLRALAPGERRLRVDLTVTPEPHLLLLRLHGAPARPPAALRLP